MSAPLRMPMPLRVPELAPSLGRLIVPRRQSEPWVPMDDVREELATAVLELGGAGRAAAAREDWAAVLEATGRAAWRRAWEHAVRRVADRVAERVDAEIAAAAARVRMPRHSWRRRLLAPGERRAVVARLAAGGGPFVTATDEMTVAAEALRGASVIEKDAHARWQDALRAVARRLEAAWLALEAEVEEERHRWAPEIEDAGQWRPSLVPIVVLWLPVATALILLGLVLGGYLPAPAWLAKLLHF
ncbi:MAG TPA: hypothetical protein VF978_08305 [Gemmatimonadales bacterium]